MIRYKSKNDIPYFKFKEFSDVIEGKDTDFIIAETVRIFNPKNLEEFSKALVTDKPSRFRYRLKMDFKKAGEFIDADTFFTDKDHKEFFKSVLKSRYFFKKINFDKISLAQAEFILAKFTNIKEELRTQYEYLYNPPMRAGDSKMTPGNIERKAFADHYGPYTEMVYVLCKGDFTKFEEVVGWDLHRFLFQAEYLIRKKDVENLK